MGERERGDKKGRKKCGEEREGNGEKKKGGKIKREKESVLVRALLL